MMQIEISAQPTDHQTTFVQARDSDPGGSDPCDPTYPTYPTDPTDPADPPDTQPPGGAPTPAPDPHGGGGGGFG